MYKNLHGRILRGESKQQHLSTVPKSCPLPTDFPNGVMCLGRIVVLGRVAVFVFQKGGKSFKE